MKTIIKTLIFIVLFYLSFSLVTQNSVRAQDKDENKKETVQEQKVEIPDDDNFIDDEEYPYDQDMISRKAMQKELEPLPQNEKIIWSFRIARTNAFL